MLCGLLKYSNEPGIEDHDVLHEKAPRIYEVIDYIDQVEVSHFFISKKSKNGDFIFEDIEGNKSFDSIAKNSLFISHNLNDKIKIIAFDSDEDAESYNAEIDRSVVDEALKIIKK